MAIRGIVFLNECCVDGCYTKRWGKYGMCKKHQKEYESCVVLSIYYGKKVQRKIAEPNMEEK
jgi:hypothetical protein